MVVLDLRRDLFFITFFFYLDFLSRPFTNQGTAGKRGGYLFNSSQPFPPASQRLRHWPGNYCRELTSAHGKQPDSNQEPLVSERKSLTTKLRALQKSHFQKQPPEGCFKTFCKIHRKIPVSGSLF